MCWAVIGLKIGTNGIGSLFMEKKAKIQAPTLTEASGKYCHSCGKLIKKEAAICVYCGVPSSTNRAVAKSQSTAVILAVFFGFWTWVYTYKKDAWKFWLNLGLSIITIGIWGVIVAWPWAIIDAAVKPSSFYESF